jgi:ATP-dependent Lon protease
MKKNLNITDAALKRIIGGYTREAGVRNLEREVGTICRGVAARYARGRKKKVSVGVDGLAEYLGNPKVHPEVAERTQLPGVATGLSWTAVGGAILFIEATRMPGKGNLVLTGQLGDVMRESAQAVMSYVRANAGTFKLEDEEFSKTDIHIHVPAGAVPKDGPSAGVTMLAAVVSLLTGKRVKNRLAMTGEITLRGMVLPVGGIKEKVLAASRAGIREVILPERNLKDLEEVPASAKKKLKVHGVERMDQVLSIALGLKLQD